MSEETISAPSPATPPVHHYWLFVVVALLMFVFGSIAVNMAVSRISNGIAIEAGFNAGALETITPVNLSPWWLAGRAQLDCQQFMPLADNSFDIPAAISRPKFALTDRKVNACTLLASVAERKRLSSNIREVSRKDGFLTAGSVAYPAISLMGVHATRWLNSAILFFAAVAGIWFICTPPAHGGRRDRMSTTLCMMIGGGFILAVPGSLTAMPTMILLIVSLGGILYMLPKNTAAPERVAKLAPVLAAALVSLDPTGGSVPVGLGCVLFLARMVASRDDGNTHLIRTGVLYVLTVVLCWILYAFAIGILGGQPDMVEALRSQFLDAREVSWFADLSAAVTGTYAWLGSESLLGKLGAFDLVFTIVCGLLLYAAVDPLEPRTSRWEPAITAAIAIAPVLLWALLYPGHWRRAEEQYVLPLMWLVAIALAAPFGLLVEAARRVARRSSTLALEVSPVA